MTIATADIQNVVLVAYAETILKIGDAIFHWHIIPVWVAAGETPLTILPAWIENQPSNGTSSD